MRFKELDNSVEWFVQTWQKNWDYCSQYQPLGKWGE